MSFPPHIPMMTSMPFFPPVAPMMIPPNMSTPPPGIPTNGAQKIGDNEKKNRLQTATTVFVGSITDRAPDIMIKRMLQHCGNVVNWKRVEGANGKLPAFGFCEYESPEGTLRCIRLLNGLQIQDKKLVVKVDAKTEASLNEYKKKKRHELAKKAAKDTTAFKFIYEDDDDEENKDSNSTNADGKKKSGEDDDDYIDDETRREDFTLKQSIETVIREYAREMNFKALEAKEQAMREAQAATMSTSPNTISNPTPDISSKDSTSPITRLVDPAAAAALDDDEGKRNLISSQIQMFRDRFKNEDTKMRNTEKERKERYERERALQREKRLAEEAAAAAKNKSATSPSSSRDRSSPRDDRHRSSSSRNNTSNSVRSRTSDRRSSPSSRSYNRHSRTRSPVSKNYPSNEDDEEAYERKKEERRLREKEIRYRECLKAWEQRERRKEIEHQSEKQRELARLRDEEKEGKRQLAFFEDYKDEIDDQKYYKGSSLARRLKDREYEIENDHRDRHREKEEIEELRQKLSMQDNIDDIEIEIKRRLEKQEELIRKRLADLIRITSDESDKEEPITRKSLSKNGKEAIDTSANSNIDNMEYSSQTAVKVESPQNDVKLSPRQTSALGGAPITGTKLPSKRKLAVNEAFRDDQDDDNTSAVSRKSKLSATIPDQQSSVSQNSPGHSIPHIKDESTNRISSKVPSSASNSTQLQEEKRQAVRKLIESIPTKKEDLFAFPLDWSLLDSNLMEKRIKPWVTKKIVEYIGEEEPALTDFICTSIMNKKNADFILADIRVVLDDEAEVFVVKMWRLIVYEIEAKRNGLNK